MYYALFDSSGNLIESFESEEAAYEAVGEILSKEPDAADEIALFLSDETGMPVRPALTGDELRKLKVRAWLAEPASVAWSSVGLAQSESPKDLGENPLVLA